MWVSLRSVNEYLPHGSFFKMCQNPASPNLAKIAARSNKFYLKISGRFMEYLKPFNKQYIGPRRFQIIRKNVALVQNWVKKWRKAAAGVMSKLIVCEAKEQAFEGFHHASPTQKCPRKTLEPAAWLYLVPFSHGRPVQINTEWPNISN